MSARAQGVEEVKYMENRKYLGNAESTCFPCEAFAGGPEPSACTRGADYLSTEEEQILISLRELKAQARFLRGKIRGIQFARDMGGAQEPASETLARELRSAMAEMEELRGVWEELQERLKRANARKLALLGHGPWQDAAPQRR